MWKNLVFLSPAESHKILECCFHIISSPWFSSRIFSLILSSAWVGPVRCGSDCSCSSSCFNLRSSLRTCPNVFLSHLTRWLETFWRNSQTRPRTIRGSSLSSFNYEIGRFRPPTFVTGSFSSLICRLAPRWRPRQQSRSCRFRSWGTKVSFRSKMTLPTYIIGQINTLNTPKTHWSNGHLLGLSSDYCFCRL